MIQIRTHHCCKMHPPAFLFLLLLVIQALFWQQPPIILLLLAQPQELPTKHASHITVQGSVFCDPCHNNTFSRYSYFLPGVEVHIQCKLRASSALTAEAMQLSVNRTTNRYGIYKLDIPSLDGIDCIQQPNIQAFCQASLKGSTSSLACNVPGISTTTNEVTLKSKRNNQCIYTMTAMTYTTLARNATNCRSEDTKTTFPSSSSSSSFNSSKFFFPYFPPYYTIPWPQLPPLPSLPPLPPLPSLPPLPPLPSLPSLPPLPSFPFSPLPPLPFLPPLPPLPSLPPFSSRPFPQVPNPRPPPSPPFTFPPFPNFPQAPPPPPSNNNFGDPRTWIPHYPPSPPTNPQQEHP